MTKNEKCHIPTAAEVADAAEWLRNNQFGVGNTSETSDEARRIAAGGEEARRLEKTRRAGYIILGQSQQ